MKVIAATITDAQIHLLREAGVIGNIVAAAALSVDATRRYQHESIDKFHARKEMHAAARHDCARAWNACVARPSRDVLVAAITHGLEAAAESESRRTMERSLLVDYIADAIEAELPDVTAPHTCSPGLGTPCAPCGISAEQAARGKAVTR